MSMELYVVLALHSSPTGEAWQNALKEQGVPVEFNALPDPARDTGFVPLTILGQQSGFYFLREDYKELCGHYPALASVKLQEAVVYSLGYGGHFLEGASAFYAASVLVARFGGVAFEPQGGIFMTERQLLDAAKLCESLRALGVPP
jgi:hypothetical protein